MNTSMIDYISNFGIDSVSSKVLKFEHFELTLVEFEHYSYNEGDASGIVIECTADKWRVLMFVAELTGWHWGEIRTLVLSHAYSNVFMHPDVFCSFICRFDEAAGGEWDPIVV